LRIEFCHYYEETASLYIDLLDRPGVEAKEVRPGVVLDFDENGAPVGIDIDHASRNANIDRVELQSLPVRSVALAG
jgi:uncharacterized protein YuzE